MPHDIIDNRTRELAPEINNFLADSIRAHFAVGYFFLSGFQAIAEHIPHLDQLRLLIGNVTNRQTIEQLAEGYHHLEVLQRAVRCEGDEPTLALPAGINQRIAAVKRDFDAEVRTREAEIRHTVGSALGRDYALSELRLVFEAAEDPEEKARLALLSEIFTSVPLTARAHRELNTLRRSNISGQGLIVQLLRLVRDYNLEEAHRAIEDRAEEAPLIPRIVCSEALL